MRDNTAKDDRHTVITNEKIQSFGVTCKVMVDAVTEQLSPQTRVLVTFIQKDGETITHELDIGELLEFQVVIHRCLSELNDIAKKQGEKKP